MGDAQLRDRADGGPAAQPGDLQFGADREGLSVRPRAASEIPDEPLAMRRARVRQHFIDNLQESRMVLDTKIDGFLAMTHLWAGEAVYHQQPLQLGLRLLAPGDRSGNRGARLRDQQLGRASASQGAGGQSRRRRRNSSPPSCILLPFVRTGMTEAYADNPKVFGRWQPRMLATHEAAKAFMQLIARARGGAQSGPVRAFGRGHRRRHSRELETRPSRSARRIAGLERLPPVTILTIALSCAAQKAPL